MNDIESFGISLLTSILSSLTITVLGHLKTCFDLNTKKQTEFDTVYPTVFIAYK